MTERTDRKLQQMPLASYSYRHEAEFAAGFLDDAGIPYRMQIDDPAMGMSVGMSATLWVRGIDLPRAREVLELGRDHAVETFAEGGFDAHAPSPARLRPSAPPVPPLGVRERGILLVSAAATILGGLFLRGAMQPILGAALLVCAVLLGFAAVVGIVPERLRRLLRALAGEAP